MLRLAITAEDRVRYVPLHDAAELRVGSAADNDVVISAPGVSRHHARIATSGRGVSVIDTGSKNGVLAGRQRVDTVVLAVGDSVRLGAAAVTLQEVSTSDADIAIRLTAESSGTFHTPVLDTDSFLSLAIGPGGAIRWMQRTESLSAHERLLDAQSLLEEARRIAGADVLLLFAREREDLEIAAMAGPLPDAEETRALARGDAVADWDVVGGPGSDLLLAAKGTRSRSHWRRDFYDYVRVKLAEAFGARGRASAGRGAANVVLSPRMIVGSSPAMHRLVRDVALAASGRFDVLILGETGTGKELVASAIHQSAAQAAGPFIAVNCAEIPPAQAEAELFGIARGAATGVEPRGGLFLAAHGGTLFLDEIGELPEALQPALLRVLQQREVRAIASTETKPIDVRVIASTNRDLERDAAQGRFRADLYYRLRQSLVRVPALRERREDIPQLAAALLQRAAAAASKRIAGISSRALAHLVQYDWPGNVRELENLLREAVLRCADGGVVQSEHLSLPTYDSSPAITPAVPRNTAPATLQDRVDDVERAALADALTRANGNKSKAAELLGITRQGLYGKLKRHGIDS
jgi:DNA-binding NtrC family response regulator